MLNLDEQRKLLKIVETGQMFEHGTLMAGFDVEEPVCWKVATVAESKGKRYVTFQLFYMEVLLMIVKATLILESDAVHWEMA